MKFRRILPKLLFAGLILALILGGGGAYAFLGYLPGVVAPQSFPQIDGQVHLPGLTAPVEVVRDPFGIPNIYASTEPDLFFAQGYLHAQDRFWQMDAWRHIGSGALSEMFGSGQVETDAFLRTLGWKQTAEAEWAALDPASRSILEAYTAGVNAYLQDHTGPALSLEYAVLKLLAPNYRVTPWTPINSLTWGKAMAWDLRGNLDEEIERLVLLKALSPAQVDELFPAYPADHPVIVNQAGSAGLPATGAPPASTGLPQEALAALAGNIALMDQALGPKGDGTGSNSWVISGALTATGKPLLANDPHLGIQMPSIWYQVGLHCRPKSSACPYEMAGFSFAGVPGVVIGHNDRIAWGFTNAGPDVMDLYIEKVNPANPNQYEVNGQWVDFTTRTETIAVAGGKPVALTVRATRHGPVVSDTYSPLKVQGDPQDKELIPFKERAGIELPEQYVIALKWTALSPSTPFRAVWGFDKAQSWEDFRTAARQFHVPAQNLVYADVDGNIGYQMPGDVPIRLHGDGRYPVPGWTDEYEWAGFVPFDELPSTFNPAEGFIATANNRIPPSGYPYFITTDWDYGFRASRIVDLIQSAPGKIDTAYIQKMQGDTLDPNAQVFISLLQQVEAQAGSPMDAAILDLLTRWDSRAVSDSPAAAFFEVFWRHLLQDTFDDDLPKAYRPDGGSRWNEVMRRLSADSPWWDDQASKDVVESRNDILRKAFSGAVREMVGNYGKDTSRWEWGEMHAAIFRNQTLGESGVGPIEALFNRGPFPTGGGEAIVNATGWSVRDGYATNWLPSMRMIVDLGNLDHSLSVHTTGQSGHAYHPHYADLAPLWAGLQYYPMRWEDASVRESAEGVLILEP